MEREEVLDLRGNGHGKILKRGGKTGTGINTILMYEILKKKAIRLFGTNLQGNTVI